MIIIIVFVCWGGVLQKQFTYSPRVGPRPRGERARAALSRGSVSTARARALRAPRFAAPK